ncbi:MAG TPA: hypothetical protein VJT83_00930, partial [Chitinophagaceae bacterium]|nr:hypothetical protein [Chitinophagaceae bacterium]
VKVSADNFSWSGHSFMITIANGSRYGGGFMVAPNAIIDDGLLDTIILPKIPVIKRFFYLPKVEKGKHLNLASHISLSKKITVESATIMIAHLDGELMIDNKFEIEILPGKFYFRK